MFLFNTAAEWHAALNDLPPTLFAASVGFDLLGSAFKRDSLKAAGFWSLIGGVLGAVLAVASGLIAEDRIQHSEGVHQIMEVHEAWAISLSIGFAVLAVWRIWRRGTLPGPERAIYLVAGGVGLQGDAAGHVDLPPSVGGDVRPEQGGDAPLVFAGELDRPAGEHVLDEQGVQVGDGGLQHPQAQHDQLLLVPAVAGDVAALAEVHHCVAAIP